MCDASFPKVPDSYHYRRRVHLYDTAARAQSETRSVDTSDLGAVEEDWFSEEAAATLLGYAEKEVMGHKVSQGGSYNIFCCAATAQIHSNILKAAKITHRSMKVINISTLKAISIRWC